MILIRKVIFLFSIIYVFGCNQNSKISMKTEQKSDIKRIEAVLNDYVTHWNNNDMDSWGTLFTDDVDYVNRNGGWWKGNKENVDGHKHIHKMLIDMGQPKTFGLEIQKIEFLKPDVAVVQVLSEWPGFKSYDGPTETIENMKGIITTIFVKTEGEWLIKKLHNTLIDSKVMQKNR